MSEKKASLINFGDGISAVDAEYVFPSFDASHLIIENGRAAFVDCGTRHSVPFLLDALQQKDIDVADVEFVFVTHVHLDHAGGTGDLIQSLPTAKAVLHPRGAPHMINPEKLVNGTINVYGKQRFDDYYGGVTPVPEDRVVIADDGQVFSLSGRTLECFFTEGHARHHYCLWDEKSCGVFAGDSFGISYRSIDTPNGEFVLQFGGFGTAPGSFSGVPRRSTSTRRKRTELLTG